MKVGEDEREVMKGKEVSKACATAMTSITDAKAKGRAGTSLHRRKNP